MKAAPARVNPGCGSAARPPCGSYDWQRQGARRAARGGAPGEFETAESAIAQDQRRQGRKSGKLALPGVTIPKWFLAERALKAAGDGVSNPHDGAEQEDGKDKL